MANGRPRSPALRIRVLKQTLLLVNIRFSQVIYPDHKPAFDLMVQMALTLTFMKGTTPVAPDITCSQTESSGGSCAVEQLAG